MFSIGSTVQSPIYGQGHIVRNDSRDGIRAWGVDFGLGGSISVHEDKLSLASDCGVHCRLCCKNSTHVSLIEGWCDSCLQDFKSDVVPPHSL